MSAFAGFRRWAAVHLMTDGLSYIDGTTCEVDCRKAVRVGEIAAVVTCTGPAGLGDDLAGELAAEFGSFDELVGGAEHVMREVFEGHAAEHRNGDAVAMMALTGWHEGDRRPGLYTMQMQTGGSKLEWVRRHNPSAAEDEPFTLIAREIAATPSPSIEQFTAAQFDLCANFECVDPAGYLQHVLEIQRRIEVDGKFYVGGNTLLTTIDASGVHQRIVHIWSEDQPGSPVRPRPIDWASMRAGSRPAAPAGLSRLQRARMEKKARKGTLRLV